MVLELEITERRVYAALILLLLAIQIYQHWKLSQMKQEMRQMWHHMAVIVFNFTAKFPELRDQMSSEIEKGEENESTTS